MSGVPAPLVGNLTADPELATTPSGKKYVRVRVATNERYRKASGEWADREPVFWDCEAWNEAAEAIAAQFAKGSAVIVIGMFRSQSWKTEQGESRTRRYVAVEAMGPNALRRPKTKVAADAPAPATSDDDWSAEA